MEYQNPKIESSYKENDLGRSLFDIVLKQKPKKIIDFGVLDGYSTIAMAMALSTIEKEIGSWQGKIFAYDLWEKYPYKHVAKQQTIDNIKKYNLEKYVEFVEMDFFDWIKHPESFDLLHLDISNKGETIEMLYQAVRDQVENGSIVLFEGGTKERDNVEWMKKYNYKKISETKVPYEIINPSFPGLSKML